MKRSEKWFKKNSIQRSVTRLSDLPVLAVLGPNNQVRSDRRESPDGEETYFVVGQSEVGGEEVVG